MPVAPIDLNHPDMVHLTQILQRLISLFSTGGFQSELREPYREYGTEILGRDLKITRAEVPAYYAAVKALGSVGTARLIAHSATFLRPGFVQRVWLLEHDQPPPDGEVLQFVIQSYGEFRRDELSQRGS